MSQRGYHLVSVRPFGSYSFNPGASTDCVYRLDYQTNKKDMKNYLQLFHDAGWEQSWQVPTIPRDLYESTQVLVGRFTGTWLITIIENDSSSDNNVGRRLAVVPNGGIV
jgi:hypothetical protein